MRIKRFVGALVWTPLFLFVLCSCAANSRTIGDVARLQRELSDLRSFQAEQTTQISALQSDMRAFEGRLQELEYGRNQGVAAEPQQPGDDLSALKKRLPPPPIVPLAQLEEDETMAGGMQNEAGRFLNLGFSKLREGAFGAALGFFQEALASSYEAEWYPNVLFWTAVSNDGLGDNKNALRAYHELASKFPKHARAPLVLLRQASVFVRLGDSSSAKLTLQKLTVQYPKSAEFAAARERLKDFK